MAERYNRLYNRVSENPIWTQLSPAVFKVFCGCLMRANYKDSKWYDGSKEIPVKRGSFVTSRERLAEFCRVSPQQARDALSHMEKLGIITRNGTSKYTVVTFCNYDQYNSSFDKSEPAEEPSENQVGTKSEPSRNQVGTTVVTESVIPTEAARHSAGTGMVSSPNGDLCSWYESEFKGEWLPDTWREIPKYLDGETAETFRQNLPLWMKTRKYVDGFGVNSVKFLSSRIWLKAPPTNLMAPQFRESETSDGTIYRNDYIPVAAQPLLPGEEPPTEPMTVAKLRAMRGHPPDAA